MYEGLRPPYGLGAKGLKESREKLAEEAPRWLHNARKAGSNPEARRHKLSEVFKEMRKEAPGYSGDTRLAEILAQANGNGRQLFATILKKRQGLPVAIEAYYLDQNQDDGGFRTRSESVVDLSEKGAEAGDFDELIRFADFRFDQSNSDGMDPEQVDERNQWLEREKKRLRDEFSRPPEQKTKPKNGHGEASDPENSN